MSPPTPQSIARRMETAAPGERRAALFECSRDVGHLVRMRQLSRRQASEWTAALQHWGQRRAGLSWAQASREIILGMKEDGGGQ
jgi:hypothetical protein